MSIYYQWHAEMLPLRSVGCGWHAAEHAEAIADANDWTWIHQERSRHIKGAMDE
jgi:hypothetical protein